MNLSALKKDARGSKTLRPEEAGAAAELQKPLEGKLRRSNEGEKGDFILESGPNEEKSVDFLFTADTPKSKEMINKFFDKNPTNLTQIKSHVDKADIVPLYMRNLNSENASKVMNFIETLKPEEQAKLILIK
ncbi:hypothetical protein [Saccharophagus degradans]|uniref:CdiA C-terminal tRNase domain-containing protein n=1 Tax=Saccharophagus degradans TaxID=86304 RepID=A0AAW7X089_9GAMM|nr:hypothetical protein [Saccharophagus degradans]MDO6421140.1 hypothetical protein [Saccharophagus degradans]MDO6605949.1 hypothetical protein [Saccharophagus degradans]